MARRSLHGLANSWSTTLYSGMTAIQTTCVIVAPAAEYPATPFRYSIGTERLRCTSVAADTPSAGNDTLTVSRGENGTSASTHLTGAAVKQYADAFDTTEIQNRVSALLDLVAAMLGGPVTGAVEGVQRTSAATDLKVQAQATPGMTVKVGVGAGLVSGEPVTLRTVTSTGTITAPVTNPRIDVVQISQDGAISVVTGTPAASPAAPAVTADNLKLAEIYLRTTSTSIKDTDDATNGYITDSRVFL